MTTMGLPLPSSFELLYQHKLDGPNQSVWRVVYYYTFYAGVRQIKKQGVEYMSTEERAGLKMMVGIN